VEGKEGPPAGREGVRVSGGKKDGKTAHGNPLNLVVNDPTLKRRDGLLNVLQRRNPKTKRWGTS